MELYEELYTDDYSNFEEWLELVNNGEIIYPRFRIPYREWVDEYIRNIINIEEMEVKNLLRFLLQPFTRKMEMKRYMLNANYIRQVN
mgnify:FL=1